MEDVVESASASGGETGWGTLEELLLVGAIARHGADWNAVAEELLSRESLLILPAAHFTPEACKCKFEALNGKYGNSANGRDGNTWPWFEEIRKRRIAQLKAEVERHDGSISSLTQKLSRLKAERAQMLQNAPIKQQEVEVARAQQVPVDKAEELEMEEQDVDDSPQPAPDKPSQLERTTAEQAPNEPAVQLANHPTLIAHLPVDDPLPDQDKDKQSTHNHQEPGTSEQNIELGVDTIKEIAGRKLIEQEEATENVEQIPGDRIQIMKAEATPSALQKTEADGNERKVSELNEEAVLSEEVHAETAQGTEEKKPIKDDKLKAATKRSRDAAAEVDTRQQAELDKAKGADDLQRQLVVEIEAEPMEVETKAPLDEKVASSSGIPQEVAKQVAEEKSDESQVAVATCVSKNVQEEAKAEAGSPASRNENVASQEQSRDGGKDGDSQVEKSDVGSQAEGPGGEDTSPTSKRLKKSEKLPATMRPHAEWLKTLLNHRFGYLFRQKQEIQDDTRYEKLVKRHIDLNMIKARFDEGGYSSGMEFFRDLLLLFTNFTVVYSRESQEHAAAVALRKLTLEEMDRVFKSEAEAKQDRPGTRKREATSSSTRRSIINNNINNSNSNVNTNTNNNINTNISNNNNNNNVLNTTESKAATAATRSGGVSISENSKSKSASVSLGVRSSRGGDEDDAKEGGEPEVSGKSKPLKAYGRKNRSAKAEKPAAAGGKESPLETIVKKEGAVVTPAAAPKKDKAAAASKEKPVKEKPVKETKSGKKANAAAPPVQAAPPAAPSPAAAVAPSVPPSSAVVRGARNKRPAKDAAPAAAQQRTGKRTRRA